MDKITSRLLLYTGAGEGSILAQLSAIIHDWKGKGDTPENLRRRSFAQVKRLLELATEYGFDENLWQNYLTFLLMMEENPFTLTCERAQLPGGYSVNHFARGDAAAFRQLFHYDFGPLERDLEIDCFRTVSHYYAVPKAERRYNKSVSQGVQALSKALAQAGDEEAFYQRLHTYYQEVGVGLFGLNHAFRVQGEGEPLSFLPIHNRDRILLSDLVGYEIQKEKLRENTEAFIEGRRANNVLLYGDSGTGKSSSVRALLNEYGHRGLRMVELYKHQFRELPLVLSRLKNRNYAFILFIDDLSFEDHEVEYKFLKAVIEGGVEEKPPNVLLYATSNRRHLIKETWKDRNDTEFTGEIHRSDTVEEKLSLSSRFGVQINFSSPSREEFKTIVRALAARQGLTIPEEELLYEANRWEMRHGGVSGRTAAQFVHYLAGCRAQWGKES